MRNFISHRTEDVVGHQVHSVLATPLRIGDQIIGIIEAAHTQTNFLTIMICACSNRQRFGAPSLLTMPVNTLKPDAACKRAKR